MEGTPEEIASFLRLNGHKDTPAVPADVELKIAQEEEAPKTFIPAKNGGHKKAWLPEEDAMIRDAYKNDLAETGKRIKVAALDRLSRKLSRTRLAIKYRAKQLDVTSGYRKGQTPVCSNTSKHKPYMTRKKPILPQDSKNGVIVPVEEPFPGIFPLTYDGSQMFKDVLLHNIGQRKATIFTDVKTLPLVKGHDWDGRTWRDFCEQVMYNIPKIIKALGIKPRSLTVTKEAGFHVIMYKGD